MVWGGGGCQKKISFHVFFVFMPFPTFLERKKFPRGGASEPVGGSSRG